MAKTTLPEIGKESIKTSKLFAMSSESMRRYFSDSNTRRNKLLEERLALYRDIDNAFSSEKASNNVTNTLSNIGKLLGLGGAAAGGRALMKGARVTGGGAKPSRLFGGARVTTGKGGTPGLGQTSRNIFKSFRLPQIPGGGALRRVPILGAALTGLDYAERVGEGQTQTQAAIGSVATTAGGIASAKATAVLLSPLLASPIPGSQIVYGLAVLGAGIAGALGTQKLTDKLTGADKVQEKRKTQLEDRLKAQEKKQKELIQEGTPFSDLLDDFERIIDKFSLLKPDSLFVGEEDGGEIQPPGPIVPTQPIIPSGTETFFPLPGGILSTSEVGVPGGEYGAEREYGGHSGQDIGGLPAGSPVVAFKSGVAYLEGKDKFGQDVIVINHGDGMFTKYRHVNATVENNQPVTGGQQIGVLGPATKDWVEHLHFEILQGGTESYGPNKKTVDPRPVLQNTTKIEKPLDVRRTYSEQQSQYDQEKAKLEAERLRQQKLNNKKQDPKISFVPINSSQPVRTFSEQQGSPPPILLATGQPGLTFGNVLSLGLDRFS